MRKILALTLITSGFCLYGQSIGNSPYASFGIGDVKYDNALDQQAMGGVGTAFISDFNNNFNFSNPAANENLQLTTVKVEGTNENNFFRSDYNSYKGDKSSTYLSNLSLAFPLSPKFKFGVGYQPYSSKRYDIVTSSTDGAGIITANTFRGEGSVNMIQAALSYQIRPELGVGIRANYFFGNVKDLQEVGVSNAEFINGFETRNRIRNLNMTLGTTYQKKYDNDRKLTVGATATLGNTSRMETTYTNSTYLYSGNNKILETVIDTQTSESRNLIPFGFSAGAGYGHNLRWFAGAQLDYKKGETIQFLGDPFTMNDSFKISAGGWVLPNANNFRSYFDRIVYKYGAYYEKGSLFLNDRNINRYAVTFGALFPYKNSGVGNMSGLDVGVEIGKRGTLENNLINQTFVNLRVGINFSDKWFRKVLYD